MAPTARRNAILLVSILAVAPQSFGADEPTIPIWTETLAKAQDPSDQPFVATYHFGSKTLGFVAADHVFTDVNPTTTAISGAFAEITPAVVIIEGYPADEGLNAADILEAIQTRGTTRAGSFEKSEAVFAASTALSLRIPFVGGDISSLRQIDNVVAKGYKRDEALFALSLSMLGQERRSGGLRLGDATAFTRAYEGVSRTAASMTKTRPVSEAQFKADYMRLTGADPVWDRELAMRTNPGTSTLLQRMSADSMRVRDEYLLSIIDQQLAANDRVLVVFGRGHWTTLSAALASKYGKPVIKAELHR